MQEQISFDSFLKESLPQKHPDYDINDAVIEARERFRTSPGIDHDFGKIVNTFLYHGFYIIGPSARKILKHQISPVLKLHSPFLADLSLQNIRQALKTVHAELIKSEDGHFVMPDAMHLLPIKIELYQGDIRDTMYEQARIDLDQIAISRFGIECQRRSHLNSSIQETLDAIGRATAWEYIPMAELTEEEAIELAVDGFTCRPIPAL